MNKLFSKIASLTLGLGLAVGVGVAIGRNGVQEAKAANAYSFSGGTYNSSNKTISWTSEYLNILQEKGESSTDPNQSYISSPRWYGGNVVTFTPMNGNKITEIVITATDEGRATKNTWSAGSASVSGEVMTWTGEQTTAFTFTPDKQVRVSSMSVTFESAASITGIALSDNGVKKSYYDGDKPSLEGIVATATYEGGAQSDVTDNCTITASPETLTLETTKVTYSATYKKDNTIVIADLEVSVTVEEAPKQFTRTYTFTNVSLAYNESYDEEAWTSSSEAYGFDDSATKRGVQFTSNTVVSLDYSEIPVLASKSVSKVTIVVSTNDSGNSVEVLAGGVNKVNEGNTSVDLVKDIKNVPFEFVGTNKGKIEIKINRSSKSIYLKSVSVEFEEIDDNVQLFINAFMHMTDYTTSAGLCKGEDGYYAKAEAAYNLLSSAEKVAFVTDEKYSAAYERLVEWAKANGKSIDSSTGVISVSNIGTPIQNQPGYVILIVMATVGAISFGVTMLLKRRKEDK